MRSVKSKLFISYTITIFLILLFLSVITIYFFNLNKNTRSVNLLDTTYTQLEELIYNQKDLDFRYIDRFIDLKNQFLIIFDEDKLIFSNQSSFKTDDILEEINYKAQEFEDEEENYERKKYLEDKYKEYFDDGFIEIDDFVLTINYLEIEDKEYEIYLGIDEKFLEQSLDDIYSTIIISNILIFLVLTLLGYLLINKTIKPLKDILEELKLLQKASDLSKRLNETNTNDEFEELTNTFNKMLSNIEKNIENVKQFSSDASHELRTPLTVIQGEIELCKSLNYTNSEQLRQTIDKIDIQQKKLQDIITNFLLLARLDKEVIKDSKASLDKVIFEAVELNLEKIEEKSLELDLDIENDLDINFDEKYLSIVINNLFSNAIKYTNEGSIKIQAKKEQNNIEFKISDTGIGIEKQNLEKVFERFYRVDKARTSSKDGIGIGLSLCKKICESFNSQIKVDSKIDKGSTFSIIFKA